MSAGMIVAEQLGDILPQALCVFQPVVGYLQYVYGTTVPIIICLIVDPPVAVLESYMRACAGLVDADILMLYHRQRLERPGKILLELLGAPAGVVLGQEDVRSVDALCWAYHATTTRSGHPDRP